MARILSDLYTTTSIIYGDTLKFHSTVPPAADGESVSTAMLRWKGDDFRRQFKNKDLKKAWDKLVPGDITLLKMRDFFSYYRLSFTCLNMAHEIIYRYRAEEDGQSRNSKLGESHLFFIKHDDRIYPLDRNRNTFFNKHFRSQGVEPVRPPSTTMSVPKAFYYSLYARSHTELTNILRRPLKESGVPDEKEVISIAYNGDIEDLYLWFIDQHNLELRTIVRKDRITGLKLYLHCPELPKPDRLVVIHGGFEEDTDPELFNNALNRFKRAMFHNTHRSEYSDDLLTLFTEGRKANLWCLLDADAPEMSVGVDIRSAYPAAAAKMTHIPAFQVTDSFVAYNGEPIHDYSIYLVANDDYSVPRYFLADRPLSGITGFVLNRCGFKFDIVGVCKPSHLARNPWADLVQDLLHPSNPMEDTPKKDVMNFTIGQLGKMIVQREEGFFCRSHDEARRLGTPSPRTPLKGWIATRKSEKVILKDGFYPFQFFVYDINRWQIAELAKELIAAGSRIYAIHTDKLFCDVIPATLATVPEDAPRTFASLGAYKAEPLKKIPRKSWEVSAAVPITVQPVSTFVEVPAIVPGVSTVIEGSAGTRKTTVAFAGLDPATTLCVSPTNCQKEDMALRFGCDAVTAHDFLGLRVAGDGNENDGRPRNLDKYTHVVFDEIIQNSVPLIVGIIRRVLEIPGKVWIANGDLFQNNNAEWLNNIGKREDYILRILPLAFPHIVRLTVNYRLTCAEHPAPASDPGWRCECPHLHAERRRVEDIRRALQAGEDILSVIQRFGLQTFKAVNVLKTKGIKKVITQSNASAHALNQFIYPEPEAAGMIVVAKPFVSSKFLVKNKEYRVESITADKYVVDGKPCDKNLFRRPAGRTCDSAQSSTITDPYAVFDILDAEGHLSRVVSRKWFYTAITRAERLDRLWIYLGLPLVSMRDAARKIGEYAKSDEEKGRPGGLTVKQMMEQLKFDNYCCHICHQRVEVVYEDGCRRQYSMDRLDNDIGHRIGNVKTAHGSCNSAQGTAAKIRDIEEDDAAAAE